MKHWYALPLTVRIAIIIVTLIYIMFLSTMPTGTIALTTVLAGIASITRIVTYILDGE
jgi:hypothetical protein